MNKPERAPAPGFFGLGLGLTSTGQRCQARSVPYDGKMVSKATATAAAVREQLAMPYQALGQDGGGAEPFTCERRVARSLWGDAAEYLQRLSLEVRRAGGRVYTPPHLVAFILQQAAYAETSHFADRYLLDPACGAGAFIVGAVLAIAARLRSDGVRIERGDGRARFLDIVESTLFGVDVDPEACSLATAAVRRVVSHVSPGPLPELFFRRNVVEADFLTAPLTEFPAARRDGFAFLVGNPPYVSATRIAAKYKERIRSQFETGGGRLDLYTVFLERSLTLLRAGGTLAMVTPDKYLASHSARALRAFIVKHGAVRTLARFRSHKIFDGAATVPCVTVVERGGKQRPVLVQVCAERPNSKGRVAVTERARFPAAGFGAEPWDLVSPVLLDVARRIRAQRCALSGRALRISAGPATGCDGVYVFPTRAAPEIEPELLKPAVRGRDLGPYEIRDPNLSFADVANAAVVLRRGDLERRSKGEIERLFRERLEAEGIPLLMSPPVRHVPGILIGKRKPDGVYPDPTSGVAPEVYFEIKNVRRVADDIQKRLYEIAEASLEMKLLYGSIELRGLGIESTAEVLEDCSKLRGRLREQIRRAKPIVVVLMLCSRIEAERYREGAEAFIDRLFFQEEIDDCLQFLRTAVAG